MITIFYNRSIWQFTLFQIKPPEEYTCGLKEWSSISFLVKHFPMWTALKKPCLIYPILALNWGGESLALFLLTPMFSKHLCEEGVRGFRFLLTCVMILGFIVHSSSSREKRKFRCSLRTGPIQYQHHYCRKLFPLDGTTRKRLCLSEPGLTNPMLATL